MAKIRKQFFIEQEQNRRLKLLATQTGKSEGEVIRESIAARVAGADEAAQDWRQGLDRLSGAWSDRDDMQDFVRELRKGSSRRMKRLGLLSERD